MSLKIIYGKADSGKTAECFEFIDGIVKNTDCNVIYMVPEQFSLQAERTVSARFSKYAMDRVEVLSFERFTGRVFSTVGPVLCDFVDDNAKLMLVERSILKNSGKLTYFNKSADNAGFASVVFDAIKTFKSNCILPDDLKKYADMTDSAALKFKLHDLSVIYEEYNKFFEYPYADSDDTAAMVIERINKFNLFSNTHIVIDNFVSFSKQQLEIVTALMKKCLSVTVTLTADVLKISNKFELFYRSKLTADILFGIARDNDVEVLPNTYLDENRDTNEELDFLKNNYFINNKKVYNEKTSNIAICMGVNYNTETQQIASEICRLVREEGYRYRDIAVITRSMDIYAPIIRDEFERYGIFYNITEPMIADDSFLVPSMTAIFDIVNTNYSFEAVFDFVRSPLCRLKNHDKFLLENYVIETGSTQKMWSSFDELKYKGSFNDYEFESIKNSLQYVRECIVVFTEKFNGRKNVSEIADAYKCFLEHISAEKTVKSIIAKYSAEGDNQTAENIEGVYNHIISSLNQLILYFGDMSITFEKFYKMLKAGLMGTEVSRIPSGVDDVIVTTIDRFTALQAKVVFVIGLTEGTIPCGYINEGVLKDSELKLLGIDDDVTQKHCNENYIIYRMFASASEKLYLSYPISDNEAEGLSPSVIISTVKRLFPQIKKIQNVYLKQNPLEEIEGVIPTFNKVIENKGEGIWQEAARWYKENEPKLYEAVLNAKKYNNIPKILSPQTVKKLYGDVINTSISRIERYNQCAYAYFIRYGLNVDERKTYEINPADYGTYMHEIIEKYSKYAEGHGWENITDEICEEKAYEITKEVFNNYLSDFYTESERYSYQFNKIAKIMNTVLKNITDYYKESDYVSLGYELEFDENGTFKPIELKLSDGTAVKLRGKIDRADIMRTENGDFVGIVDYKSSNKNIEFEKILCGIQIQLPVYIRAVCENLSEKGNKVLPAAMLYYHIDDPVIDGDKNMSDAEIYKKISSELKMKGIVLENGNIPSMYVVKNRYTDNQIDKLCKTAYRQIKRALESMIKGNISIYPVRNANSTACDYCPYFNICNFDSCFESNKYNDYKKISDKEFFEDVNEMDR